MNEIIKELVEDPEFKQNVKFVIQHFKADEKILLQGVVHPSFYLIKNGGVRVVVSNPRPGEVTLRPALGDLGPGDIFGEFGLIDDLPASADVSSLGETDLLAIDIPSFRAYLDTKPALGYQIYQELAKTVVTRLRQAGKAIYRLYEWGIKAHHLDEHLK